MKESVIYQDIFQKGKKEEVFELVSRLLNRKFGAIDSSIIERLRVLTRERLEELIINSEDFSKIYDLETWLNR